MSATELEFVNAVLVSVPFGTAVETVKLGVAGPEPFALSLSVHGTVTSVPCHAAAGDVHTKVGGVRSTLIAKVGSEVLTSVLLLLLVIMASGVFELSRAWYVTVVVPSTVPGIVTEPLGPLIVPVIGVEALAPEIV
jgi:hypothetical protein